MENDFVHPISYNQPDDTLKLVSETYEMIFELMLKDCQLILECPVIELKIELGFQLQKIAVLANAFWNRSSELGFDLERTEIAKYAPYRGSLLEVLTSRSRYIDKLEYHATSTQANLHPTWDQPTVDILINLQRTASHLNKALKTSYEKLPTALTDEQLKPMNQDNHWTPARDNRFKIGAIDKKKAGTKLTDNETIIKISHMTLMGTEIPTIEACADLILQFHDVHWDFVMDMTRQIWDEARHSQAFLEKLEELNGEIGSYPTDLNLWKMCRVDDLPLRLCVHQRIGEWIGIDAAIGMAQQFATEGDKPTATLLEFIARDEVTHVAFGNKWIKKLVTDEASIIELQKKAEEIRVEHGAIITASGFPCRFNQC